MKKTLLQLRSELESRFDVPAGIRRPAEKQRYASGIAAIDELTGGGIPRGTLTEICGPESSGRTALLFAVVSGATGRGECCGWVDAAGVFDPASAAETGIELRRVFWVDCGGNTENALKATDLLLQAGGFGLIVLDLADTPQNAALRIPLAFWFRLRQAAERTDTALIVVGREVNAGSCSTMQIEMRRTRPVWKGKLLRGIEAVAESRRHSQARRAEFLAIR